MDRLNLPLRQLGPKLLAVAVLVAALLWGAWLTQQVTSSPFSYLHADEMVRRSTPRTRHESLAPGL